MSEKSLIRLAILAFIDKKESQETVGQPKFTCLFVSFSENLLVDNHVNWKTINKPKTKKQTKKQTNKQTNKNEKTNKTKNVDNFEIAPQNMLKFRLSCSSPLSSSWCSSTTDTGPPVVSGCPADVKATTELGTPTATVTWTEPTATDEATFTTVRSHVPGESFSIGTTHVAYIYTDRTGKTSACSFSVIVETGLYYTVKKSNTEFVHDTTVTNLKRRFEKVQIKFTKLNEN